MTSTTMRAVHVPAAGQGLTLGSAPVPEPQPQQVRIKVEACGVCHGEAKIIDGWASAYPRIPGHEIVGVIDALGDAVRGWRLGQRVGVGWHGGQGETTGMTVDGGYAEYTVAREESLVAIPSGMSPEEAAPILCAGETVFSALRNSHARIGDLVAVSGIGGLGHLAIQYAVKAGYEVAAISRGRDKAHLARELGAHHYVDAEEGVEEQLNELGGASLIIATAPHADAIKPLLGGLAAGGELVLAAVSEDPIGWSALDFLGGQVTVKGTFTDASAMSDAIDHSILTGVRPRVEVFPLEEAPDAYQRMMNSDVRFRAVLKVS
ncbi:alcohol dehydrogenase catalytic domain-containing protein [Gordonia sp. HY002]|uniref:alcohol dehydrogenase catalytic domain-containing protein n=1 Tax=Gordonia zhenghanii TaxID=2911516 RepID=UPI001EF013D4|nr:zinc-binding dehydrogenase [Gordonia zhenghanii]MCF8572033.1 alcohol dehydrogenase catalytic domain-containing protein [Gordonia zhenghanii]MCF8604303.1 alcohol dehydrogenase catalytic domain-containing protein [Gordonia zhenghanii]